MYKNKNVLAVIPARAGSKGLPGKNIRMLSGKPLLAWTIKAAKRSRYIDRLILSSDSGNIMKIAARYGCETPFKRPEAIAKDKTPMADVLLHVLKNIPGYDYLVLLQPTSPLRSSADIDGCIKRCVDGEASACISVYEPKANPYWIYRLDKKGRLSGFCGDKKYLRRQELPKVYAVNGAVYCAKVSSFLKRKSFVCPDTLGYIMPQERSIDIDCVFDLKLAEIALKRWNIQEY